MPAGQVDENNPSGPKKHGSAVMSLMVWLKPCLNLFFFFGSKTTCEPFNSVEKEMVEKSVDSTHQS